MGKLKVRGKDGEKKKTLAAQREQNAKLFPVGPEREREKKETKSCCGAFFLFTLPKFHPFSLRIGRKKWLGTLELAILYIPPR